MSVVYESKRAKRKELIANIGKQPVYMRFVVDLIALSIEDVRDRYENTAPANESLRGQLVALKALHAELSGRSE